MNYNFLMFISVWKSPKITLKYTTVIARKKEEIKQEY